MVRTTMGTADFAHSTDRVEGGAASPAPSIRPLVSGASSRTVTVLP